MSVERMARAAAALMVRRMKVEDAYDAGGCVPTRVVDALNRDTRRWLEVWTQAEPVAQPKRKAGPYRTCRGCAVALLPGQRHAAGCPVAEKAKAAR